MMETAGSRGLPRQRQNPALKWFPLYSLNKSNSLVLICVSRCFHQTAERRHYSGCDLETNPRAALQTVNNVPTARRPARFCARFHLDMRAFNSRKPQ